MVYEKNLWGADSSGEFFSGPGSHNSEIIGNYTSAIKLFLESLPYKPNAVDLGCGDFNVGRHVRDLCNRYIACDVVPALIERNANLFGRLDVDFRCMDITTDSLPSGDIVFIRQVLQHLSNKQIECVVRKLSVYKYLILTEHLPLSNEFSPNIDKPIGAGTRLGRGTDSGIVLTLSPFNLSTKSEQIICEVPLVGGIIRTTVYEMR